jgi:predicted acetyltransferase
MELRKPILSDKEKLLDYIKEHHDNGEINISASNGITSMEYEMWLEKLKNDEEGKNIEWGIS